MEQIYVAFVEAVLDPIEERFGKLAATLAALALVALPMAGVGVAVWIVTHG